MRFTVDSAKVRADWKNTVQESYAESHISSAHIAMQVSDLQGCRNWSATEVSCDLNGKAQLDKRHEVR